jgi:hypothetical protein
MTTTMTTRTPTAYPRAAWPQPSSSLLTEAGVEEEEEEDKDKVEAEVVSWGDRDVATQVAAKGNTIITETTKAMAAREARGAREARVAREVVVMMSVAAMSVEAVEVPVAAVAAVALAAVALTGVAVES